MFEDLEAGVNFRAMFCPECRVEYRPGFTHCTDCDVDLVDELPAESERQEDSAKGMRGAGIFRDGEKLRMVWEGDSETDCVDACRDLQEAGIEYRVNQSAAGLGRGMSVDFHYKLAVRADDYESARKALGYTEEGDEDTENGVMELETRDDQTVDEIRGDWNQSGWFPEDATLEVWRGNPKTSGTIVEMALKENRINYRVEQSHDSKRVFVLPEDEVRAREIVKEIVEGVPPE